MKSVLSIAFFTSSFFLKSQDKIEAKLLMSVDTLQTSQVKYISCRSSIDAKNPLFIVDGVPTSSDSYQNVLEELDPDKIISISVLKDAPAIFCDGDAKNGVVLITTKKGLKQPPKLPKKYAFKVYKVCNSNWTNHQDMYNAIQAKVPGVSIIKNNSLNAGPNIQMRGDDNTIVIVDGIRYGNSILNTLNPADIESVKVSNSTTAQNYFINN